GTPHCYLRPRGAKSLHECAAAGRLTTVMCLAWYAAHSGQLAGPERMPVMCTVAAAPETVGVRVWQVMSRGRASGAGQPAGGLSAMVVAREFAISKAVPGSAHRHVRWKE